MRREGSVPYAFLIGDRSLSSAENAPAYSRLPGSGNPTGGAYCVPDNTFWSKNPSNDLHDIQGNFNLCDGSVQQMATAKLQQQLVAATNAYGTNINHFLFPQ